MPRATIDYPKLRNLLAKKYPYPLFRQVRLVKPERYNRVRAPTAVYDRATGNYKRIGYKVQVELEQFVGMVQSEGQYRGFITEYKYREFEDVLFTTD